MSRHLSSQEISEWMIGERGAERQEHVRECARCAAEIAHVQGALSSFRASVHGWSEQVWSSTPPRLSPAPRHGFRTWSLRFAAVAAVLLIAGLVPLYNIAHRPRSPVNAQADAQLLEEVDAGVSRSVPRTMEPLMALMAGDSTSALDSTTKDTNNETQQQN
jgi:hypothetical protein